MKRTFTVLLALAVLVALALPASAARGGKPAPPPDEPPAEPVPCVFDQEGEQQDWVLQDWDGSSQFYYRCQWIVEDRSSPIQLRIEAAGGAATSVRGPNLAVTDVYPHSGDICERQHRRLEDLPFDFTFTLPDDGECEYEGMEPKDDTDGPNIFALNIGVKKVTPKKGTVQLVWVNHPSG